MIRIHYPYPTNGHPAVTATVPRRGQQDIEVTILCGADKYDTFKLTVKPSRAVNPPWCQYVGGVKRTLVRTNSGSEYRDTDDRVDIVNTLIANALQDVASKGHITAAQAQVKAMFKKLDKAPHKEPVSAADRKAS